MSKRQRVEDKDLQRVQFSSNNANKVPVPFVASFPPGDGPTTPSLANTMRARVFPRGRARVYWATAEDEHGDVTKWVANVDEDYRDKARRFAVMAVNRRTGEVSLTDVGPAAVFRRPESDEALGIVPATGQAAAAAAATAAAASAGAAGSRQELRSKLTQDFGSQKRQRAQTLSKAQQITAATVIAGASSQGEALGARVQASSTSVAEASATTSGGNYQAAAALPALNTSVPPYDAAAKEVSQVYVSKRVIPPSELRDYLDVDAMDSVKDSESGRLTLFRGTRLTALGLYSLAKQQHNGSLSKPAAALKKTSITVAFYGALCAFHRLPKKPFTVAEMVSKSGLPVQLVEHLVTLFAEPTRTPAAGRAQRDTDAAVVPLIAPLPSDGARSPAAFNRGPARFSRTKKAVDTLINYVCVTALLLSGPERRLTPFQVALVCHDLRMNLELVSKHFRAVGCRANKSPLPDKDTAEFAVIQKSRGEVEAALGSVQVSHLAVPQNGLKLFAPLHFPQQRVVNKRK